nr:MAG: hypothetical protein DIU78_16325 [Pseudomonadota bacterium]
MPNDREVCASVSGRPVAERPGVGVCFDIGARGCRTTGRCVLRCRSARLPNDRAWVCASVSESAVAERPNGGFRSLGGDTQTVRGDGRSFC